MTLIGDRVSFRVATRAHAIPCSRVPLLLAFPAHVKTLLPRFKAPFLIGENRAKLP